MLRSAVAALLVLALAACTTPAPGPTITLNVFAAASLTESFEQIETLFEKEYPEVDVVFNFGASSTLAQQITQGAPADVFAAASPATMQAARGEVEESTVFVRNSLTIAVPRGNPANVKSLDEFADEAKTLTVCAPEVPCGALAEKVFADAGIDPRIDNLAADAEALITLVELGEVDAGLAYRTDIQSRDVDSIALDTEIFTDYPIALTRASRYPDEARAFVDFVLSERGREIFGGAGFTIE